MELEPYEIFYYSYQTEGRGLKNPEDLRVAFKQFARANEEIFGPLLPRSGVALDVACGYGNMLFYFEQHGLTASGFDLDQNQVDLARSIGLDARRGDIATELSRHEGDVDVISAMDVIEHLDKNVAVGFLGVVYKLLPKGGILVLRCPCADGFTGAHDVFNDMTHKWGATSIVIRQILLATGFERVELMDISLPRFPTSLHSRMRVYRVKIARRIAGTFLRILGMAPPSIWSASVVAIAWK
jgi:SAM-dependent methyltransferase